MDQPGPGGTVRPEQGPVPVPVGRDQDDPGRFTSFQEQRQESGGEEEVAQVVDAKV